MRIDAIKFSKDAVDAVTVPYLAQECWIHGSYLFKTSTCAFSLQHIDLHRLMVVGPACLVSYTIVPLNEYLPVKSLISTRAVDFGMVVDAIGHNTSLCNSTMEMF